MFYIWILLFLFSLFWAKRNVNNDVRSKFSEIMIGLGLFVPPFFYIHEIFSWFDIDGGGLMAWTYLIFYIALIIYIGHKNLLK